MHNEAHIAFVDAHAKGNGSTHDLDGACAPLRMNAMFLCFIQIRVVHASANPSAAVLRKGISHGMRVFAA